MGRPYERDDQWGTAFEAVHAEAREASRFDVNAVNDRAPSKLELAAEAAEDREQARRRG